GSAAPGSPLFPYTTLFRSKTFDLRDRERPLTVHGPPGLRDLLGAMRAVYGRLSYELRIAEVQPGDEVRRDGYTVAAVGVEHRIRSEEHTSELQSLAYLVCR